MGVFMLFTAVSLLSLYLVRLQLTEYKIDQGVLVVKNGFIETEIPMTDIVEVIEMDKKSKTVPFTQAIGNLFGRRVRIAVFTSSNVSYLFLVRNTRRLLRRVKEQNPKVHIKAKVKAKVI